MTTPDTVTVLACGAAVGPLLEQAVDSPGRRTGHQRGCVHCQAALAEFEDLWVPVRESAAVTPVPPPDLVNRVISRIRAAVASPGWALIHSDRGVTRVAVELVVRVVRDATQSVPGVRSSLVSVDGPSITTGRRHADRGHDDRGDGDRGHTDRGHEAVDAPGQVGVDLGVSGSTVAVLVTVAVDYGPDLLALGAAIRRQVERHAEAVLGIRVASVSVRIDDVLPPA